ncbi:MAG: hypothetical protein WEB00_13865 [Dehalococcoidia bacterium]
MKVSGSVSFRSPPEAVYGKFFEGVFAHAIEEAGLSIDRPATVLTSYETKVGPMTVVTTEEATLDPGRSITWRHRDGPLSPSSWETFSLEPDGAGTTVLYEADIEPRNRLLKGPLNRFWVAPQTRKISLRALRQARRELEGS